MGNNNSASSSSTSPSTSADTGTHKGSHTFLHHPHNTNNITNNNNNIISSNNSIPSSSMSLHRNNIIDESNTPHEFTSYNNNINNNNDTNNTSSPSTSRTRLYGSDYRDIVSYRSINISDWTSNRPSPYGRNVCHPWLSDTLNYAVSMQLQMTSQRFHEWLQCRKIGIEYMPSYITSDGKYSRYPIPPSLSEQQQIRYNKQQERKKNREMEEQRLRDIREQHKHRL